MAGAIVDEIVDDNGEATFDQLTGVWSFSGECDHSGHWFRRRRVCHGVPSSRIASFRN
jgi:hypothetical protein